MIANVTTTFLKAEKAFKQEKYSEAKKLLNKVIITQSTRCLLAHLTDLSVTAGAGWHNLRYAGGSQRCLEGALRPALQSSSGEGRAAAYLHHAIQMFIHTIAGTEFSCKFVMFLMALN